MENGCPAHRHRREPEAHRRPRCGWRFSRSRRRPRSLGCCADYPVRAGLSILRAGWRCPNRGAGLEFSMRARTVPRAAVLYWFLSTQQSQIDQVSGCPQNEGMSDRDSHGHNSQPRSRGRPPTGETPKRCFRADDELGSAVVAAAEAQDKTTSEYIRSVLERTGQVAVWSGSGSRGGGEGRRAERLRSLAGPGAGT